MKYSCLNNSSSYHQGDIALIRYESMEKFNNSKLCVRNSVIIPEEQPATQSLITCYTYYRYV